jgi:hypothetical protein
MSVSDKDQQSLRITHQIVTFLNHYLQNVKKIAVIIKVI